MITDETTECFFCIIEGCDPIRTPVVCDICGKPACSANNHIEHVIEGNTVRHICRECLNGKDLSDRTGHL